MLPPNVKGVGPQELGEWIWPITHRLGLVAQLGAR